MPEDIAEKEQTVTPAAVYKSESQLRRKRRRLFDRWAKWVVALGGFTIIASILAILIFIVIEIAPLFRPAKVEALQSVSPQTKLGIAAPVAAGLDEYQEIGYVLSDDGRLQFFETAEMTALDAFDLLSSDDRITSVSGSLCREPGCWRVRSTAEQWQWTCVTTAGSWQVSAATSPALLLVQRFR